MLFLLLCSFVSALADPACVLSPSGKMLCCGSNDYECLAKIQKAHSDEQPSPPASIDEPVTPSLVGALHTFANATVWDRSSPFDVAVIGVPFGLEAGYEAPGMQLLRRETCSIPPYSRLYGASMDDYMIVDGQDLMVGGVQRMGALEQAALPFFQTGKPVVTLGGDHSITVPLLRAAKASVGEFAMIHIDKDLAIGNGSLEQALRASTAMFWGAASSLFDTRHSLHVASRANLPSHRVELIDEELGFQTIAAEEIALHGVGKAIEKIRERLSRRDGTFMPAYISLDLDVLDSALLTNSEVGGIRLGELRAILAGLRPFCVVIGAEIRDVSTLSSFSALKVAAAVAHDLVLLTGRRSDKAVVPLPLKHEL